MHDIPTLLLIENDEGDFRCVATSLRSIAPAPRISWACSAADAVAYLEGRDGYADRKFFPLPDLILLDLKTPPEAKLDFVRWLRASDAFGALPVLAFSSCGDEFDAARAAEAGVTAFFHLSSDERRRAETLERIVAHWRSAGASRFARWPGAIELPQSQSFAA